MTTPLYAWILSSWHTDSSWLSLPSSSSSSHVLLLGSLLVLILCWILAWLWLSSNNQQRQEKTYDENIPWAPQSLFGIGHAMAYKRNPRQFLRQCQQAVGPIFRINLAGRRMIVVGAHVELQRQFARQPDSKLSLVQAVAQVGFDYTLGIRNVMDGTEFHKRLLKTTIYRDWDAFCQLATQQMRAALQTEINLIDRFAPLDDDDEDDNTELEMSKNGHFILVPNLFRLARIVMLRTTLAVFFGTRFVNNNNPHVLRFLQQMMELQDKIENATAAAAVLPRNWARWLVLQPTQKFRLQVQQTLWPILESAQREMMKTTTSQKDLVKYGPWLWAMQEQNMETELMAEYVVGFLFAAHKNSAIGAAQAICHLWEQQQQDPNTNILLLWRQVHAEARALVSRPSTTIITWDQFREMTPTIRACVDETMRIAALPLSSIRTVCKTVVLEDGQGKTYTLYPRETISTSPYLYNVDPTLFPHQDLDQYQPHTQTNEKEPNSFILTFSQGTHKCPGERIAAILMTYFVALLLERDATPTKPLPPISFDYPTLAQRKGTVTVRLRRKKRNNQNKHNSVPK